MNTDSITTMLLENIASYGLAVLGIITTLLVIMVGYLVYTVGVQAVLNDKSLKIFGIYARQVPWKGYRRFKSKDWNLKHTL